MVIRNNCCLCSSDKLDSFVELDHRKICKCRNCGFVFASRYDKAELFNGYMNYYPSSDAPKIQKWIDSHSVTWKGLVQDITRYSGKKNIANILDIGAGTGGFLEAFHLQYPMTELYAVESSPEAVLNLKGRLPYLKFPSESADGISSLDNSYDVITLLQCLEHVPDPLELCNNIYRLLAPGGILLVTVPNRYSYKILLHGFRDPYCYSNKTHLQFFSINTLHFILRKAGFKKIKRICRLGGSEARGLKILGQYILRNMGLSTELRFIVGK